MPKNEKYIKNRSWEIPADKYNYIRRKNKEYPRKIKTYKKKNLHHQNSYI